MKLTRLQKALNYMGFAAQGVTFDDALIITTCPDCFTEQTLADMPAREENGGTHYRCKRGCRDLAMVLPVPGQSGAFSIGSVNGLEIRMHRQGGRIGSA